MEDEKQLILRIPGKRVTPSQFRSRMGDFLARVQYGKETLVIATRGKRAAIVCPPENWQLHDSAPRDAKSGQESHPSRKRRTE